MQKEVFGTMMNISDIFLYDKLDKWKKYLVQTDHRWISLGWVK
jgi:TRAP-type C4-dicarboxylate transport system substrate-binding protein